MKQLYSAWPVFLIFLRLGLTSFGGPVAHLGYFRAEFVSYRHWLSERTYADLVALCQFLPGPASSQVGLAIGYSRAGYLGAFAAWFGFTLPSAIALILFALGLTHYGHAMPTGVIHGLKIVAVAVVAQAIWGMGRSLCPDAPRIAVMLVAATMVLLVPTVLGQVAVLSLAAVIGLLFFKPKHEAASEPLPLNMRRRTGFIWLGLFLCLLIGLPFLATLFHNQTLTVVDAFYRAGSLVFGGGHVVLPLLQAEAVPTGWVTNDAFLAGYGVTQAVPGPLFTFAAFLGASMHTPPNGWVGGFVALAAIFLPSFLLVLGALPFWEQLRHHARMQAALIGINAAVVGLLLAALYQPVWTSAIHSPADFALAALAFVALMVWKVPPWLVVAGSALLGVAWAALL